MCVLFAVSHFYSICILHKNFSSLLFARDSQQAYQKEKLSATDNIEKERLIPPKKAFLRLQLITYQQKCTQKCQRHDSATQAKSGIQPFICACKWHISRYLSDEAARREKKKSNESELLYRAERIQNTVTHQSCHTKVCDVIDAVCMKQMNMVQKMVYEKCNQTTGFHVAPKCFGVKQREQR